MAPAGSFTGGREPCRPDVGNVRFDGEEDAAITSRLAELFAADQEARSHGLGAENGWERIDLEDGQRRVEVMAWLVQGKIRRAESLYQAAMIFQHGNCPAHFQLTADLAERAGQLDYPRARWLYAAAIDRYLMNLGKPQKYGTQFTNTADGRWRLYEVDPAVDNAERARYGVPPLAEARKKAKQLNQ